MTAVFVVMEKVSSTAVTVAFAPTIVIAYQQGVFHIPGTVNTAPKPIAV